MHASTDHQVEFLLFLYFSRFFENLNSILWNTLASTDHQVQFLNGLAIFHRPWHTQGLWKIAKNHNPLAKFCCGNVQKIKYFFHFFEEKISNNSKKIKKNGKLFFFDMAIDYYLIFHHFFFKNCENSFCAPKLKFSDF